MGAQRPIETLRRGGGCDKSRMLRQGLASGPRALQTIRRLVLCRDQMKSPRECFQHSEGVTDAMAWGNRCGKSTKQHLDKSSRYP